MKLILEEYYKENVLKKDEEIEGEIDGLKIAGKISEIVEGEIETNDSIIIEMDSPIEKRIYLNTYPQPKSEIDLRGEVNGKQKKAKLSIELIDAETINGQKYATIRGRLWKQEK